MTVAADNQVRGYEPWASSTRSSLEKDKRKKRVRSILVRAHCTALVQSVESMNLDIGLLHHSCCCQYRWLSVV